MNINKTSIINYDTEKFPFKEIIEDILSCSNLSEFHRHINYKVDFADQYNDQETPHHKKFYSQFEEKLIPMYSAFMEQYLKPKFEEEIVYQGKPTFRCNIPQNRAVPYHRDSDFNHDQSERNFWLPFTDTNEHNTIYIESERGKRDFKPYILKYGEILFFDGANLEHGNKVNESDKTRMSMDFRIIVKKDFKDSNKTTLSNNTKMKLGEYWKW